VTRNWQKQLKIMAGLSSRLIAPESRVLLVSKPARREMSFAGPRRWGIARVEPDTDGALRKHYPGTELTVSLAWAAAEVAHAPITKRPAERRKDRWLLYYGPYGTIRSVPYWEALDKPPGFFKGKIVFVGGKPRTRFLGRKSTNSAPLTVSGMVNTVPVSRS
jgi:hypothetical protein